MLSEYFNITKEAVANIPLLEMEENITFDENLPLVGETGQVPRMEEQKEVVTEVADSIQDANRMRSETAVKGDMPSERDLADAARNPPTAPSSVGAMSQQALQDLGNVFNWIEQTIGNDPEARANWMKGQEHIKELNTILFQ